MSAQHTPGRLRADGTVVFFSSNAGGFDIRCCLSPEENARRLVACWNACEGITTQDLEVDNVLFTVMLRERITLKAERDELLAALKLLMASEPLIVSATDAELKSGLDDEDETVRVQANAWLVARAAIAKAEGGAAPPSQTPLATEVFANSEDPRCKDGGNACMDCLMRGECLATPPAHTPTREINPGERYAGLVLDAVTGLPSHHLVLLPGEAAGMNWEDASKWAKEQGGDLPTRQEQSLLFANLKSEFQPEWYWSGEKASEVSAWYQVFRYGFAHNDTYLTCEVRVRAVRRLSAAPPAQTPSWVDVAAKTKIARAVYERLRSHIQGLGPWSALDADTVQALADAVTLPPAQTPRREPLAIPGINKAEGGAA